MRNISCLKTVFKNTSGLRKTFSFFAPHGRVLAANAEVEFFGGPAEAVMRLDRGESRRHVAALERALQNGDIAIVQTPNVVLTDDANPGASPQMLRLHNATLGVTDPCWTQATSESQELG
jgi:hypothetical protein